MSRTKLCLKNEGTPEEVIVLVENGRESWCVPTGAPVVASVSQIGTIASPVTIEATAWIITTMWLTTAAWATESTFTVNNPLVTASSVVVASVQYERDTGARWIPYVFTQSIVSGSFKISVSNISQADPLNSNVKIHFTVS